MNPLYVDQLVKVRVILESIDIRDDYEKKLKQKVMKTYGDRYYLNGFIDKKSIEIIRIEMGRRIGAHLHGFSTFNVEFTARFCVPKRETLITCRVQKVNKFGVEANEYPMNIIVPKQLHYQYYSQKGDKNPMEKFEGLEEGKMIRVMSLSYGPKDGNLVVVGVIEEVLRETSQLLTLTPSLLTTDYQVNLLSETDVQTQSPEQKPMKKNPKTRKNIDTYALIDIDSPIIKYGQLLYSPQTIYQPTSRTYFKFREIFSETTFLDLWKDQELHITVKNDAVGGVIQSLVDYRNYQHQNIWVKDKYHITDPLSDTRYSGLLKEQGYQVTPVDDVSKSHVIIINNEMIDDSDPSDNDRNNRELFSQLITAMSEQLDGGLLIVKVFSIHIQIIQMLSVYYGKIQLIKPVVSHPIDNEKYLICSNFTGITPDKLDILREIIPQWQQHQMKNMFEFVEKPNSGFRSDLATFNQLLSDIRVKMTLQQEASGSVSGSPDRHLMGERWCHKYGLPLKTI